jgi:acyl carrier protein
MGSNGILSELNDIFIDVLDNDNIVLTENSSAKEIDEWDSLSHIQLVVAIEKKYKIRFSPAEILKWKKVGDIVESIEQKKGA